MLEIAGLRAGYGPLQVLWEVSLAVSEGEFVALLGPNGAGKTTALRTVSGIIAPMGGQIWLSGRPIGDLAAHEVHRMGLSFIPEDLNLFGDMSVRENLLLGAYGVGKKEKIRKSLEYVFHLFPVLADRRSQLAGTLSGGERKMLALARGLMSDPTILLVDEPSLGLAPLLAVSVLEALLDLNREGVTILVVEQNVHATLRLTDRAYVLEHGRIVLEGASASLLEDPHVQEAYLGVV